MLVGELARDIDPPFECDIGEALGVLDEAREAIRSGGIAANPRMDADRHHPAEVVAVVPQPVEGRLRGLEEVFRLP